MDNRKYERTWTESDRPWTGFLVSTNTSVDKITMLVDMDDAIEACRQALHPSIILSIMSIESVCGQVVGQNLESW